MADDATRGGTRRVLVHERRRVFDDFFKIEEAYVSHELFDATMGPRVRRLVFERGDAVSAVIFNRDSERVLLVEQFRFPTYDKGPGWTIELVAGIVDEGEPPEDAIRREIHEEAGYEVERLEKISTFYLTPGGSSERVHLYYAEVSASGLTGEGGGRDEEHEDIKPHWLSLSEVADQLVSGGIPDAKTIIGLQWLLARDARSQG